MSGKSLDQWLHEIERLHPSSIDLGLERIGRVLSNLGIKKPNKTRVITVAGTNGKGSCVHALHKLLAADGQKVGCYTSPHLQHFNERLLLNGNSVTDNQWIKAFEAIDKARAHISLTYFEITTLAAIYILSKHKLDYWILEVGLGGRLDAVNVIDPDIAVITSIAKDHMDWLGNTLTQIATEKMGIMRPEIPVFLASSGLPTVIHKQAKKLKCKLIEADKDYHYQAIGHQWHFQDDSVEYFALSKPNLPLASVAVALSIYHYLSHKPMTEENLSQVLSELQLAGRFEQHQRDGINIVLDVAHNPQASKHLAQALQAQSAKPRAKVHAVLAMLADKQVKETVKPMLDSVDNWFIAGLDCARGMSNSELMNRIQPLFALAPHSSMTVVQAYREALAQAKPDDTIVVFGSFYTVAAVEKELARKTKLVDKKAI